MKPDREGVLEDNFPFKETPCQVPCYLVGGGLFPKASGASRGGTPADAGTRTARPGTASGDGEGAGRATRGERCANLDCYWVGSLDVNFLENQGVFH